MLRVCMFTRSTKRITHRCEVNVRICHDILKRMAGIKTDWKDEILANAELGTLEKAYNGVVSVKDIGDLKDKLSSMNQTQRQLRIY